MLYNGDLIHYVSINIIDGFLLVSVLDLSQVISHLAFITSVFVN